VQPCCRINHPFIPYGYLSSVQKKIIPRTCGFDQVFESDEIIRSRLIKQGALKKSPASYGLTVVPYLLYCRHRNTHDCLECRQARQSAMSCFIQTDKNQLQAKSVCPRPLKNGRSYGLLWASDLSAKCWCFGDDIKAGPKIHASSINYRTFYRLMDLKSGFSWLVMMGLIPVEQTLSEVTRHR